MGIAELVPEIPFLQTALQNATEFAQAEMELGICQGSCKNGLQAKEILAMFP